MPTRPMLTSYIAPAAPATRRYIDSCDRFLRPEIGFTPKWYSDALGIDFGEQWHTDPVFRKETIIAMKEELKRRFVGTSIGQVDEPQEDVDLLTGTYGACLIASLFDIPIIYYKDNWPNCEHKYLSDCQVDNLEIPDFENNSLFCSLMRQIDKIAEMETVVRGFINWQGVLNNAYRIRGSQLFMDFCEKPERSHHLLSIVTEVMIRAGKLIHQRQKQSGFNPSFYTVSNCLVNMVSPEQYEQFILPYDKKIALTFGAIGIHNCAWNANPYMDLYSKVPYLEYIDMGIESDLSKAKKIFKDVRRALMYTPMDLQEKNNEQIEEDLNIIAENYGPCDVIVADIESQDLDKKVLSFIEKCKSFDNLLKV